MSATPPTLDQEQDLLAAARAGVDQLTTMIQAAFQQSLESLRRYVEDKLAWDAN